MCKVGDGLSRPVLIARETFSRERYAELKCKLKSERSLSSSGPEGRLEVFFSQVIYCGGYSGEEPPLPIPNREVKLTIADGTAPPGGRVGSCRSSNPQDLKRSRGFLFSPAAVSVVFVVRRTPAGLLRYPPPKSPSSGGGLCFCLCATWPVSQRTHGLLYLPPREGDFVSVYVPLGP